MCVGRDKGSLAHTYLFLGGVPPSLSLMSVPDPTCTFLNFIFLQKSLINYINLHQGCLHLALARQPDQSDLQNNNVCLLERRLELDIDIL